MPRPQSGQQWTRRNVLESSSAIAGVGIAGSLPSLQATAAIEPDKKQDWWKNEFRKLVTLGESTTAGGWSTTRQRCWVSRLGMMINDVQYQRLDIFNAGIGSNVISTRSPCYPYSGKPAANERLQKHVFDQHPDLLIISYGLNDARGGTPVPLFQKELTGVVKSVRQQIQPLIVLLGPYFMTDFMAGGKGWQHANLDLFKTFNRSVAEVARQQECLYVDLIGASGEASWLVHNDGVHQSDLGHLIVANRIFEVLLQHVSGLALHTQRIEKTSPRWRDESKLKADYGY